ncbi:PAS domain-containing protein [Nafulsella turpanensis]|uniref:PAS domain-containing protein n=1 Tax=Nafulsella turpanensis TaxID=1265690 RepID=UPI00135F1463|nr:PAS domain-containing protein [Nafulsella turpanensis]
MGFITALLLFLVLWQSQQLEKKKTLLLEQYQPAQQAATQLGGSLHKSMLLLTAFLETGKETYRADWERSWEGQIVPEKEVITALVPQLEQAGSSRFLQLLQGEIAALQQQQQSIVEQVQQLQNSGFYSSSTDERLLYRQKDIREQLQKEILPRVTALNEQTVLLITQAQNLSREASQKLEADLALLRNGAIAAFILCIILGVGLGYFLISQLFRSLYHIKRAVKELRRGNLPEEIRQSKNETAHITAELKMLTQHLQQVEQLALRIGEGNFDQNIDAFENEGALGESLASMKSSLSRIAMEDRQRNWVNEGFAKFGDLMRENNQSISALCDAVTRQLVKYVNANQGAIFLLENEDTEMESAYLNLTACYAYEKKKYVNKQIFKGEGLVGQAWQEKDTLLINDVPEEYINIRSGLGGSNPKAILMVPLAVNEDIQGVLELASFRDFEEYQITFIKKVAENLAAAVANARNNERTLSLLEESQELAEAMRAQEEEMRQNMEELEATQEEMVRAQVETNQKEQNLNSVINNTTDTIFAIDRDYRITVVNQVLKEKYKSMGIMLETGTYIHEILPEAAWQKWKARYDRALAGEQYSIIEESSGSKGTKYSQTYHNPIVDENGAVTGVSVISRDVTETVVNQQLIQRKQSTLNAIINSTDDTYFAIDTDYRILIANKTLKGRFALSGISLEEGDNIFDKLAKEQHAYWKNLYDRALGGESFVINQERPVGDKVLFIEVYCNPILDEESGKVMGASVMSKDITRWKSAIEEKEAREQELKKLRQSIGLEESLEEQGKNGQNRKSR